MIPGQPIPAGLAERVRAWIADDPDAADRAELQDLLDAAARRDTAGDTAAADLADRFAGRLEFGTAGLRGAMGAGPNRMNRAVVRAATAGLARWLHEHRPPGTGVVLGWDARHRSAEFAGEAAAVLTGAAIPVHLLPGRSPTPLLAFAIRHLSAAAGVMITASHNPPRTTATSCTWATARRSSRPWTPRSRPRSAAWARCRRSRSGRTLAR